ncbi:MAG: rhodanese-like domain-containing protein, partial [Alphaproteobacteria bacterium]
AALRLARLERPVKIMAGGITGWIDEGFALARQASLKET